MRSESCCENQEVIISDTINCSTHRSGFAVVAFIMLLHSWEDPAFSALQIVWDKGRAGGGKTECVFSNSSFQFQRALTHLQSRGLLDISPGHRQSRGLIPKGCPPHCPMVPLSFCLFWISPLWNVLEQRDSVPKAVFWRFSLVHHVQNGSTREAWATPVLAVLIIRRIVGMTWILVSSGVPVWGPPCCQLPLPCSTNEGARYLRSIPWSPRYSQEQWFWDWGFSSVAEPFPSTHKSLSSVPSPWGR